VVQIAIGSGYMLLGCDKASIDTFGLSGGSIVGDLPLLVPGVGAQGGDAATVMEHGAGPGGRGLIVNSSRAILYASAGDDFAEAARAEAVRTAQSLPC
jgi:orotidine-5'-phosphate decarboxylase